MPPEQQRDFFISHASPDQAWAEWIADRLERSGYQVELDVWDWAAGEDFVTAMESALKRARRVIAVYSEEYFRRPFAGAEHRAVFAQSTYSGQPRLIPIIIDDCTIPKLYDTLIRIDLIEVDEETATRRLLNGISSNRSRPNTVAFPRAVKSSTPEQEYTTYPGARPAVWRLPTRNPFFVGRTDVLEQIDDLLRYGKDREDAVAIASLQGMGGIGKTQIAIEYSHRCARHYGIVWWIDGDSPDLIEQGLTNLADELSLTASSPERSIEKLWSELSRRTDWLLIYDNIDSPASLTNLRPPTGGNWLVTTRNPAIERFARMIEVREFQRQESVALLEQRVPALTGVEASRVAEALGDLPLAVEQAGYYLRDTGYSADEYVPILLQRPSRAGLSDATIDRHPGLVQVVEASILRLEEAQPDVARALKVIAVLAPESLPIAPRQADSRVPDLFGVVFGDGVATAELVRELSSSGLVRRLGRSVQMHRLVQLLLVSGMTDDDRVALAESGAKLVSTASLGGSADPQEWPKFSVLLPHVQALVERHPAKGWIAVEPFLELVLGQIGYLYRAGRYSIGLELAEQCEPIWRSELGDDRVLFLRLRNNKGMCLTGLSRFAEATALYRELVDRYSELLGQSDSLTLGAANNVGVTLSGEGKFSEAVEVLSETVDRMSSALGDDHIETLRASDNLVEALTGTAEYARAIDIATRTLATRRRVFPHEHPDALETAHNLGSALRFVNPDQARAVLTDTLRGRQSLLGLDHPNTVRTRNLTGEPVVYKGPSDVELSFLGACNKGSPLFRAEAEHRRSLSL